MKLGIVVGQVVATRKDENLTGSKLLILRPCAPGQDEDSELVAVCLL